MHYCAVYYCAVYSKPLKDQERTSITYEVIRILRSQLVDPIYFRLLQIATTFGCLLSFRCYCKCLLSDSERIKGYYASNVVALHVRWGTSISTASSKLWPIN